MSKRGDKPRRLMTKVRRRGDELVPKNAYDRNKWKRKTEEMIDAVCTCLRMYCICEVEEKEGD